MEQQKIDLFMVTNQKYFDAEKLPLIKEKLEKLDDNRYMILTATEFKDPTTMLIFSVLVGGLGVDRFMLGDTGMGVLKLLTGGCCGILTIIDWFTVSKKTKEYNFNKLLQIIM